MRRWRVPAIFGLILLQCRSEPPTPHQATVTPPAVTAAPSALSERALRPTRMPPGCALVMRVDVHALLRHPGLGRRWAAALAPGADAQSREARAFGAMLRELDLSPERDLRELGLCLEGRADRFVAVLGGDLPPGIVDAMQRHDPERNRQRVLQLGGQPAIARGDKVLVQSRDRVLVFGNDEGLVTQALEERADEYRVPRQGELALVLRPGATSHAPLGRGLERGEFAVELLARRLSVNVAFDGEPARARFEHDLEALLLKSESELEQAPAEMRQWLVPWFSALRRSSPQGGGASWSIEVVLDEGVLESSLERLLALALGGGRFD